MLKKKEKEEKELKYAYSLCVRIVSVEEFLSHFSHLNRKRKKKLTWIFSTSLSLFYKLWDEEKDLKQKKKKKIEEENFQEEQKW